MCFIGYDVYGMVVIPSGDITKTCSCNVYPLETHFYIAKLGFAGVYLFSYFCSKTGGGSYEYPQSMF